MLIPIKKNTVLMFKIAKFVLVALAVFFLAQISTQLGNIASELSSMNSNMSAIEYELSDIKSEISVLSTICNVLEDRNR